VEGGFNNLRTLCLLGKAKWWTAISRVPPELARAVVPVELFPKVVLGVLCPAEGGERGFEFHLACLTKGNYGSLT
jgi:hypothetical protein